MDWSLIASGIGVAFIFLGCVLTLITAVGLLRLPDLLARMHAATKPQVFGLMLLCLGGALVMQSKAIAATLALVMILQLISAPISAHMLSNAAFKAGKTNTSALILDEYSEDIAKANEN
uniref:monovalent cation/H(+) antiporter subunit G n=1 Tax=Vaginimicrobium propionicum TaxID=1871034 RepID=UPI00097060BA|nr:monovalent cation/H(+) antiporter subunit G [Vaginimicrobium propionicum]